MQAHARRAEVTPVGEIIGPVGHYRFAPSTSCRRMWEDYDRPVGKKGGRQYSVTCSLPKSDNLRLAKRSPGKTGLRFCTGKLGRKFGQMSEAPTLDVPKLTEQEMQQLQVLLFRYLTHKSSGFADIVTDKLVNRCQATVVAEPKSAGAAPPPPVEAPKRKGKAAQAPAS